MSEQKPNTYKQVTARSQQALFDECTVCCKRKATKLFTLHRKIEETDIQVLIELSTFPICEKCSKRYYTCQHCKITFNKSVKTGYKDDSNTYICADHKSLYHKCGQCGQFHRKTDVHSVRTQSGGKKFCGACYESYSNECLGCGNRFTNGALTYIEAGGRGRHICNDCKPNYEKCPECEDLIYHGEFRTFEVTGERVCRSCYRSLMEESRTIKAYDYRPRKYIHRYISEADERRKPPMYGIEIEMDTKTTDSSRSERAVYDFHQKFDINREFVYCKEDGSLPSGAFELVSHPWSLNFHIQSDTWENFLYYLRFEKSCVSYYSESCGIHIHRSKSDMGKMDQTKLGLFINEQQEFIEVIAQRRDESYGQFYEKGKYKKKGVVNSGKYMAINFKTGRKTIELRVFKGSLVVSTVKAYLEFYDALCSYVKVASVVDVCMDNGHEKFIAFARKYRTLYPHLYKHLIRKKIFKSKKYPPEATDKPWAVRPKKEC